MKISLFTFIFVLKIINIFSQDTATCCGVTAIINSSVNKGCAPLTVDFTSEYLPVITDTALVEQFTIDFDDYFEYTTMSLCEGQQYRLEINGIYTVWTYPYTQRFISAAYLYKDSVITTSSNKMPAPYGDIRPDNDVYTTDSNYVYKYCIVGRGNPLQMTFSDTPYYDNKGALYYKIYQIPTTYQYLWDFGDGTTSNLKNPTHTYNTEGTYIVSFSVSNTSSCSNDSYTSQCLITDTIAITSSLNATITPVLPKCPGDTAFTLQSADAGGIWSGNGITDSNNGIFGPATAGAGTHIITYSIGGACGDTDTVNLVVFSLPKVYLGEDDTITCEESIILDAGNGFDSYDWHNHSTNSTLTVTDEGKYYVTIQSGECYASDTITIYSQCSNSILWVPNVFTPNGDGINDKFPKGDGINDDFYAVGENITCYKLLIFNRWGEKLFETEEFSATWDGTYKGSLVSDGVYVWIINYCGYENGKEINKDLIGHVTMLK